MSSSSSTLRADMALIDGSLFICSDIKTSSQLIADMQRFWTKQYGLNIFMVSSQRNNFSCATYVGFPICPQFQFVDGVAKGCIDKANSHDQTNSSVGLKQWSTHCVAQKRFGLNCCFLELHMIWWKNSYNFCKYSLAFIGIIRSHPKAWVKEHVGCQQRSYLCG